jgi:hypothetical protein
MVLWILFLAGSAGVLLTWGAMFGYLRGHARERNTSYECRDPFAAWLLYKGITSREEGATGLWAHVFVVSVVLLVIGGVGVALYYWMH